MQSVDEVGDAKGEWYGIVGSKDATRERFAKLEDLNKLLRSVGQREGLEVAALHGRWEELELTLDAFNDRVEDQMTHLRGQMAARISEMALQVQKFSARWFELKPKKLDTSKPEEMKAVIARIKEWQSEFREVVEGGDKLLRDCNHFGLAPPTFAGLNDVRAPPLPSTSPRPPIDLPSTALWPSQPRPPTQPPKRATAAHNTARNTAPQYRPTTPPTHNTAHPQHRPPTTPPTHNTARSTAQSIAQTPPVTSPVRVPQVRADIDSYVASCALFEQYMSGLEKLAAEDWISFRQRTYVFDDFVAEWREKATGCPPGAIADHLRTELAAYQDLGPLLKLVRGDAFQPEHWSTLFRKLEIEKVSLDKLCLSHFLGSTQKLLEHAAEIKELNARATGEVAIREAIQEMTSWSLEAQFSLTSYSNNGRTTHLIKDWKDMTTEVSDKQALLASLKDSHFFKAFKDVAEQFETKLSLLDQVLTQLNPIQRKWVYLEPIFARGAMPNEQPRFQRVDDEFTSIMQARRPHPSPHPLTPPRNPLPAARPAAPRPPTRNAAPSTQPTHPTTHPTTHPATNPTATPPTHPTTHTIATTSRRPSATTLASSRCCASRTSQRI